MPKPNYNDAGFKKWWANILTQRHAMGMPLDSNPIDPTYDYYALYKSGWKPPKNWATIHTDARGHFPDVVNGSALKSDTNPRAILNGIDTRTGQQVAPPNYTGPLTALVKAASWKYKNAGTAKRTKAAGWDEDAPAVQSTPKPKPNTNMPGLEQQLTL